MKLFLIFFLLFFICKVQAQEIFAGHFEKAESEIINESMESMTTSWYLNNHFNYDLPIDTTIVFRRDTLQYYLAKKEVASMMSDKLVMIDVYDREGAIDAKKKVYLDDRGRITEEISEPLQEGSIFNDYHKLFMYENDKLLRKTDENNNEFILGYDTDDFPLSLSFTTAMGNFVFSREDTESGYRFNGALDFAEEFLALLGEDKNSPAEEVYVLYEEVNGNHKFSYYKGKGDSAHQEAYYIRDKDGNLIEFDEIHQHMKFYYNEEGVVLKVEDVHTGETLVNEFDENGNPRFSFGKIVYTKCKYDEHNNIIEERNFLYNGRPEGYVKRKIVYKK